MVTCRTLPSFLHTSHNIPWISIPTTGGGIGVCVDNYNFVVKNFLVPNAALYKHPGHVHTALRAKEARLPRVPTGIAGHFTSKVIILVHLEVLHCLGKRFLPS